MKILVFGKTGQVATELQRQEDVIALDRRAADLSRPEHCAQIIVQSDADVVINAAAYTAVDKAESDEALATVINGDAPTAMAHAAAARGLPFLHVSTDYVFDGSGSRAWAVKDQAAPINAYGRSKLVGERGIVQAGGAFAILRTSWVFSAHGNNFVKTMLRLGRDRDHLSIVKDQIGGPTAAADIADCLLRIARRLHANNEVSGIYHYAGAPDVSWKSFADEIFKQAGIDVTTTGIATTDYSTPALRPLNSRLDCATELDKIGVQRPDWRHSLTKVLIELGEIKHDQP